MIGVKALNIESVKIIEMGVNVEIKIKVNGMPFYSHMGFETKKDAKKYMEKMGIKETES